ncbi:MAG: hypothetical protein IKL54_06000 [Bacteroidaceae bacterium]|nr:hypothetical protein [Bacteroidaceae bacterium]
MQKPLNGFTIYKRIVNENFIDFIMDNIISNANAYAAFLDGEATKDEMYVILKKMMRDSQLIMALNLAAVVNSKNNEKPYNAKRHGRICTDI